MHQDPGTPPSPATVERAVERVFADAELRRAIEGPPPLDDGGLVEMVVGWIRAVERWLRDLQFASPGLYVLLIVALLLVLALLLWHIAYSVRLAFRKAPADALDLAAAARRQHFRELHASARELAARGELRAAARALLLALLALIEERRTLSFARGWTTREILARLAVRIGYGAELTEFGAAIEATSYGGADVDAATFARLDRSVGALAESITPGGER